MKILTISFIVCAIAGSALDDLPIENIIQKAFEDSVRDLIAKNGNSESKESKNIESSDPLLDATASNDKATMRALKNLFEDLNKNDSDNQHNQDYDLSSLQNSQNDAEKYNNNEKSESTTNSIPQNVIQALEAIAKPSRKMYDRYRTQRPDNVLSILNDIERGKALSKSRFDIADPDPQNLLSNLNILENRTPQNDDNFYQVANNIVGNFSTPINVTRGDVVPKIRRRITRRRRVHRKVTRIVKKRRVEPQQYEASSVNNQLKDIIREIVADEDKNRSRRSGEDSSDNEEPTIIIVSSPKQNGFEGLYPELESFMDGRNSLNSMNDNEVKDIEEEGYEPSSIVHRLFNADNIADLAEPYTNNQNDDDDDEYNGHAVDEKKLMKEFEEEDNKVEPIPDFSHYVIPDEEKDYNNWESDSSDDMDSDEDNDKDNVKKKKEYDDDDNYTPHLVEDEPSDNSSAQLIRGFIKSLIEKSNNNDIDENIQVIRPHKVRRSITHRIRKVHHIKRRVIRRSGFRSSGSLKYGFPNKLRDIHDHDYPYVDGLINQDNYNSNNPFYDDKNADDTVGPLSLGDITNIKPVDMINYLNNQDGRHKKVYKRRRTIRKRHIIHKRIQKTRTSIRKPVLNPRNDQLMKKLYSILSKKVA